MTDLYAKSTKEKKEIEVNGNIGIEMVREDEFQGTKLVYYQRAFLVNGKSIYQVIVTAEAGSEGNAEVRRFFESLRLPEFNKKAK